MHSSIEEEKKTALQTGSRRRYLRSNSGKGKALTQSAWFLINFRIRTRLITSLDVGCNRE